MNFPELNLVVQMKRNDMFLATPVLTIAFRWYVKAGFSVLTLWALAFPSVSAVAAVNVQAEAAFQHPYARIVVRTWFRTHSQQLLVIPVDVAGCFHNRFSFRTMSQVDSIQIRSPRSANTKKCGRKNVLCE